MDSHTTVNDLSFRRSDSSLLFQTLKIMLIQMYLTLMLIQMYLTLMRYNAIQCNTMRYNAIQYDICDTIWYNAIQNPNVHECDVIYRWPVLCIGELLFDKEHKLVFQPNFLPLCPFINFCCYFTDLTHVWMEMERLEY